MNDNLGGAVKSCPGAGNIHTLTDLINFFTCTLMQAVLPLLGGLAVIAFIYGVIQYFLNPNSEEKRKAGKSFMFWGLVTLFVMTSLWAIVGIFSATFLSTGGNPVLPKLPETINQK